MAKKEKRKFKLKIHITREILLSSLFFIKGKVNKVPASILIGTFFFLISLIFLNSYNRRLKEKVLGINIQMQADQKSAYEWEQLLTEKPDFRDGWLQLSSLYAKMGNVKKAKEAFNRAKEIDPNFTALPSLEKLLKE